MISVISVISVQWKHIKIESRNPADKKTLNPLSRHKKGPVHICYRQLDFPSEPGVANEILDNEP